MSVVKFPVQPTREVRVKYVKHAYVEFHGMGLKCVIHVAPTEGPDTGEVFEFFCNATKREKGYQASGPRSKLGRCMADCLGNWKATPAALTDVTDLKAEMRLVTADKDGKPLRKPSQYKVIDALWSESQE